jgi:hypothetical protein
MISRTLTAASIVLVALGVTAAASADVAGPACWKLGNNETYRLFFVVDSANPAVVPVAGEVLAAGFGPRPISGSAIPSSSSGTVSMILTIGKGFDGATGYFVRADFNLGDFKGQGVCQIPSGAASGCDQGPFAWTPVACP